MNRDKKTVPGPDALRGIADGDAEAEAMAFEQGNLDVISKTKEHGRRERLRDNLSYGAVGLLWILMIGTGAAIFILAWHYLAPKDCGWLDDGQLAVIKAYIFSGSFLAAVSGYIRKHLD